MGFHCLLWDYFLWTRSFSIFLPKYIIFQFSETQTSLNDFPFAIENHYLLITPSELYTNYEKLFFPFDQTTWILLTLTFSIAFAVILVVNQLPRWIRNYVYGDGVEMPAYNMVGIFFGIGQVRLPRHYFSRTILILFVWFCLIFRTCYQSMMFEFTTSDMQKPLPETLEDLFEHNYTIVFIEGMFQENFNRTFLEAANLK